MGLHEIAMDIIQAQLEQTKHLDIEWFFCNRFGGMPKQTASANAWKKYRAKHNISVPPYSLRHTFVTITQYDLPLERLKDIVGHSVKMDTRGTYGHEFDGQMEESVTIQNSIFTNLLKNFAPNFAPEKARTPESLQPQGF